MQHEEEVFIQGDQEQVDGGGCGVVVVVEVV